jgi:hypothetical protein
MHLDLKKAYFDEAALGLTKREHFAAMAMQGLIAASQGMKAVSAPCQISN